MNTKLWLILAARVKSAIYTFVSQLLLVHIFLSVPHSPRSLDPFINENDCYIHAGALKMTAPIL